MPKITPFNRAAYLYTTPAAGVDCAGNLAGVDLREEDFSYLREAYYEREVIDNVMDLTATPNAVATGRFVDAKTSDLASLAQWQARQAAAAPFVANAPGANPVTLDLTRPALPAFPAAAQLRDAQKNHIFALHSRLDSYRRVFIETGLHAVTDARYEFREYDESSYTRPLNSFVLLYDVYVTNPGNPDYTRGYTRWTATDESPAIYGLLNPWWCDPEGALSANGLDQGHKIVYKIVIDDNTPNGLIPTGTVWADKSRGILGYHVQPAVTTMHGIQGVWFEKIQRHWCANAQLAGARRSVSVSGASVVARALALAPDCRPAIVCTLARYGRTISRIRRSRRRLSLF